MKRKEIYDLFSELAGHPSMKSVYMMRPKMNGDAVIGPFIEPSSLEAILSEMGSLAIQAGEILMTFIPNDWNDGIEAQYSFSIEKQKWINEFYPDAQ